MNSRRKRGKCSRVRYARRTYGQLSRCFRKIRSCPVLLMVSFGVVIIFAVCSDRVIVAEMHDLVFVPRFCSRCHYNELLLRDCCRGLLKAMRAEFLLWSEAKVAWFLQDIFVFSSSLSRCVSEVLQVISCADEFQCGKLI